MTLRALTHHLTHSASKRLRQLTPFHSFSLIGQVQKGPACIMIVHMVMPTQLLMILTRFVPVISRVNTYCRSAVYDIECQKWMDCILVHRLVVHLHVRVNGNSQNTPWNDHFGWITAEVVLPHLRYGHSYRYPLCSMNRVLGLYTLT